jgi:hypothetical protein
MKKIGIDENDLSHALNWPGGIMLRARVKATGDVIEVKDYGPKFIPRYWTEDYGYLTEDLDILG